MSYLPPLVFYVFFELANILKSEDLGIKNMLLILKNKDLATLCMSLGQ